MKIAFINPNGAFFSKRKQFQDYLHSNPKMKEYLTIFSGVNPNLLTLAALTPSDFEIEYIDENIRDIDFSKKYDLVAITAMTQQAIRAYQIADLFRSYKCKVILGGIHISLLPQEALMHSDAVVIGEAEYCWSNILNDIKKNKLQRIYKETRIVDLKDSPIPAYNLIKNNGYKTIWMQTTRGCPHDCEFCAATKIFGKKYRTKSIDQIIEEITVIKNTFGNNVSISFSDDNFFVNKNSSKILLKEMIGLNIRWHAQSDISVSEDDEILKLIHDSGGTFLLIGFESVQSNSLKDIDNRSWKFLNFKKYTDAIYKIQSNGIGVQGAFIIGLDKDDKNIFDETAKFVIDNNLYEAQITISTPLPGTRLRERLEKEGRILNTDWSNYTFGDVNFIHPTLSKEELENGLLHIYKLTHTPEFFLKKMEYFKSIQKNLIQTN